MLFYACGLFLSYNLLYLSVFCYVLLQPISERILQIGRYATYSIFVEILGFGSSFSPSEFQPLVLSTPCLDAGLARAQWSNSTPSSFDLQSKGSFEPLCSNLWLLYRVGTLLAQIATQYGGDIEILLVVQASQYSVGNSKWLICAANLRC